MVEKVEEEEEEEEKEISTYQICKQLRTRLQDYLALALIFRRFFFKRRMRFFFHFPLILSAKNEKTRKKDKVSEKTRRNE
jgi:hypothetical protein